MSRESFVDVNVREAIQKRFDQKCASLNVWFAFAVQLEIAVSILKTDVKCSWTDIGSAPDGIILQSGETRGRT